MVAGARVCTNCGENLVAGDRFCAACGTRVDRTCSACGVMLVSGDRFCPDCGAGQEATGPNASASNHSSAWDAVVRVLRSSLAGEYRITRELGRGGQAAVFLADELALNRMVAIKVLAPGNVSGEREVELFRREAQTIANLKHPHIVTMYSVRQIEDLHLFVMQYIEGRSLAAIIADRGPLPLTAIRAVAFQIGNALQYAHRRNVIHRDVKPANVLFDEDGNAILTDFGIAKDAAHTTAGTLTASFMGTAGYMSPEQCQQRPATWATDQYSLGVLLYEMLTGGVPFEGSQFAVMQGHTDREPPSIRTVRGDCPVELEWAVMRMLAKRPAERWPSIPDALAALGAGPLTRDDPIRGELKRLARWAVPDGAAVPPRLTLRVPEQLEVGESAACEVFSIGAADATPQRITATWRVTDTNIANCDDKTGLLKGLVAGNTMVVADTAQGKVDAQVNVVPAAVRDIQFTLARATLTVGETAALTCEVRDRRGSRLAAAVEWSVTEPEVAQISGTGAITALTPGMTSVIARVGDISAERSLFVQEANAASLVIAGGRSPLLVPETLMLSATVFDANGKLLGSREVRWTSSDVRIASVDRYGVVRAVGMGDVLITAQSGAAVAEMSLEVNVAPVMTHRAPPAPVDLEPQLAMGDAPRSNIAQSNSEADDWNSAATTAPVLAKSANDSDEWEDEPSDDAAAPVSGFVKHWRSIALVGIPLLLVSLGAWKISNTRAANALARATAKANAIIVFAPEITAAMAEAGRSFDQLAVDESFTDAKADAQISVANGVFTLAPGTYGYGPASWKAAGAEFVAHAEIGFTRDGTQKQGGLVLRASATQNYFIQVFAPEPSGFRVSLSSGANESDVVPFRSAAVIKPGNNSFDALMMDGALQVFINGKRVATTMLLSPAPDGQVGVVMGKTAGVSFDNVVIISLKH